MGTNSDLWCILRVGSQRTIALAESLAKSGFHVWTPVATVKRRRPRSKLHREITVPIMPSYVFARADQLPALFSEASNPATDHPNFTIARWAGKIPTISDRQLDALRVEERRAIPPKKARQYEKGDPVRVLDGAWAGLPGIVKTGRGRYVWVDIPGFSQPIRFTSMLLMEEAQAQSVGIAA
ncbi:MAG TPA: transcription termination/antitermination NusG family protein [Sphingopyxis sp.]|jgi:transcription antitermination factor NusG|uniref:transcription termination/antitermination protein NusG n=1 Tax=Sphingopyxis sp. TaxID=1908224 RepID=UPI002E10C701|nr:transcription termination/antitermination NusG family protein [Sphingopyxis sp.]